MTCQACGAMAPTKYVAFYQNIGLLVLRLTQSVEGELCKPCIHKYYWKMTGINATLGWWGTISLIVTPFLILNNTFRYLGCLGMKSIEGGSAPLSPSAVEKLRPHTEDIAKKLNAGMDLHDVAEYYAAVAGVKPGQVLRYLQALVAAGDSRRG